MLNQVAFLAFGRRTLQNTARGIPGSGEEDIAIWNVSIV
jgi:hypothetical protein